jgi:hypothetical protein
MMGEEKKVRFLMWIWRKGMMSWRRSMKCWRTRGWGVNMMGRRGGGIGSLAISFDVERGNWEEVLEFDIDML